MAGWKFSAIWLLVWISTCVAQRSSFGESCDDTKKCDKRAWLTCTNGSCQCLKPDVMMYEDSLGKCASKAGERCKFIIEEFENNNAVFEMMSCIKNSKCSSKGFCVCDNKYYENLNGTCIPAKSHMETCDSVVKCSKYEALHCTDGFCKCNETVSTFFSNGESSDGHCVGLAGESCINSKCISNAVCSNQSVCVCDDEHYQDDDKQCVQKVGALENCTRDEHCMKYRGSQLLCLKGVCTCDPSFSQYGTAKRSKRQNWIYSDSNHFEGAPLTQCLGLAGSPCLDRLCVKDSSCNFNIKDYNLQDDSGICLCKDGLTKSKHGNCAKGYTRSCVSAFDCIEGLVCGGHGDYSCRCPYVDQVFDSSTSTCVSKVDGPCGSLFSCVTNAECVLFSKEPFEAGHCSCKKGYVKNIQGKCDLAFGSPCTPSSCDTPCDTAAGLQCLNFKCQCKQFAKFSSKHRKCLGLVGANCDLNSKEPKCVENSKCERVDPQLQGICTCSSGSGFKETPQYTCEVENENSKKIIISHAEE